MSAALLSLGVVAATNFAVRSQVSRDAGFTIEVEETRYDPTGEFADRSITTYVARSDGSQAQARSVVLPDGRQVEKRSILDATTYRRIGVDGATESTITVHLQAPAGGGPPPPRECSPGASAESREILGYTTYKHERRSPPDAPSESCESRVTEWLAPELGCFPLARTLDNRTPSGTMLRTNEWMAISVITGPPDGKFFEIPEGYVERKPSEVMIEHGRRYPTQEPTEKDLTRVRDRSDIRYQAGRRPR